MKTWKLLWLALLSLQAVNVSAQVIQGGTSLEAAHDRWESYAWSTDEHTRFRASTWALGPSSHAALLNASMSIRDCSVALWTVRVEYDGDSRQSEAAQARVMVGIDGHTLDWSAKVKTVAHGGQLWVAVVNRDLALDVVNRFAQARGALVEVGKDVSLWFSLDGFVPAYERLESLCREHRPPTADPDAPAAPVKLKQGRPAYG